MRLEQLQYLVEISNSKSISIASENLYISQPALSRAGGIKMGESANKINKGLVLKWLITVIVPIIIWMIQDPCNQYCNSQSFKAPANFGNTPVSNSVHQTYTTIKFFLSPYLFLTAKLGAPYELGEMNFFTFFTRINGRYITQAMRTKHHPIGMP